MGLPIQPSEMKEGPHIKNMVATCIDINDNVTKSL